jgi:hypothetical protein
MKHDGVARRPVVDPGEKKVDFQVGGYGSCVFFESPR